MTATSQIAKHVRDIHFGGNWTFSNMKDSLSDLTWEEATTQVYSCNTIATLTYHVNYFVDAALKVLKGGPLDAHDKFSFDHPPIHSQDDWQKMLDKTWSDARSLADLIEQLPDNILYEYFTDRKYGNYFRNFLGIVEHMHYHLGQIVIIKKIIRADRK